MWRYVDKEEYRVLYSNVIECFNGNRNKTLQWFTTTNLQLGSQSPNQMITKGKIDKLIKFVDNMKNGNVP